MLDKPIANLSRLLASLTLPRSIAMECVALFGETSAVSSHVESAQARDSSIRLEKRPRTASLPPFILSNFLELTNLRLTSFFAS